MIAELATSRGARAPLAQVANQVFIDLVRELDVSTDGKVVVGHAKDPSDFAVKWSGSALSAAVLGPGQALCTNGDDSVIGGYSGSPRSATIWDRAGVQRTVKDLLGATPDLTSDWTLDHVVGNSDDGKFLVGTKGEGWVAHLP